MISTYVFKAAKKNLDDGCGGFRRSVSAPPIEVCLKLSARYWFKATAKHICEVPAEACFHFAHFDGAAEKLL